MLADAAGDADVSGEPDAPGEPEAPGLGLAFAFGNSARPIWTVRIRTYDLFPEVVIAAVPGRPCSAITAWTWLVVGVPLAKWISQTVPPVKSIENWRPSLPPVSGVRRMKMKPGTVISRLIR